MNNMIIKFDPFLTRLWTTDKGGIVGGGFLVTKKHVLTCAHVVNNAFGVLGDCTEKPTEKIVLDFPFLAPNNPLQAQVIIWYPAIPNNPVSDIAVLELENELPRGCQPVSLLKNQALSGHSFKTYGFPAGYNEGLFAEGEIKDMRIDGTVQGHQQGAGYGIAPGFSGCPVLDEQVKGIVGMVVAADRRQDNTIAFFIHTDSLVKAWHELEQYTVVHPETTSSGDEVDKLTPIIGDEQVLELLDSLSTTQLKKVFLLYKMPKSEIPPAGTQGEQIIALFEYALQKEKGQLTELLGVIYKAAPHLS